MLKKLRETKAHSNIRSQVKCTYTIEYRLIIVQGWQIISGTLKIKICL